MPVAEGLVPSTEMPRLRPMNVELETERLILRPWSLDDFEDFAAMSADPEVMRYLTVDGKPLSRFASRAVRSPVRDASVLLATGAPS